MLTIKGVRFEGRAGLAVLPLMMVALAACQSAPTSAPLAPSPQPTLAAPTATSTPVAPTASPVPAVLAVGTYVTSISLDDLRGKIPEHELCENAGAFTLTFETKGTWTLVQEPVAGCTLNAPIGSGTYRISDGRLEMTQDDPFGCDPGFSLAFARSGATLTFSDPIDRDCIERDLIYTVNPWTAK